MKQLTLWLLIGLLALSGCEGGARTNVRSRCSGANGPNVCTVTVVSIEGGAYRHNIKNRSFWPGTGAVEVTVRVTVEKGIVQVWLEDPQKNKTLVRVKPGQTAELKGIAWVTGTGERSFSVYFEPLGETKRAENVQAEIRYNTQHTISKSPRNSTTEVSSAVGSSEKLSEKSGGAGFSPEGTYGLACPGSLERLPHLTFQTHSERVEHVKMGPRSFLKAFERHVPPPIGTPGRAHS
jgi:hypothetical protein